VSADIKPDSVSINMIGSAGAVAPVRLSSSMLKWKYTTSGGLYSAELTLPVVRGYPQTSGTLSSAPVQKYTINRTGTSVMFNVGQNCSQSLTSNLYFGMINTVNNLLHGAVSIDLGIKFTSKYSIPATTNDSVFPITVLGDYVEFKIENPNQINATSVGVPLGSSPVSKRNGFLLTGTLKDYGRDNVYTFSGTSFASSGASLSLRPTRVKINTNSYQYPNAKYVIFYKEGVSKLSKATPADANVYDDLGNPALYEGTWSEVATRGPDGVEQGFDIGLLNIKQDAGKIRADNTTTYLQFHAPRLLFTCMSSVKDDGSQLVVPFDYNSVSTEPFKVRRFLRYNNNKVYKPFGDPVLISDINGFNRNLQFHGSVRGGVNDMTFTYMSQPSLASMLTAQTAVTRKVTVPGTILKIVRNYGRSPNVFQSTELFNAPITSMSQTLDILDRKVYVTSRDSNNMLYINLAQDVTLNGFTNTLAGHQEAWQTNDESKFYNIEFKLDNTSWYRDANEIVFDINADGVSPMLYSAHQIFDRVNRESKVRVYKYDGATLNIDSHNVSPSGKSSKQTLCWNFLAGRKYVDLSLPAMTFTDDPNSISNHEAMLKDVIMPETLTWLNDANFTTEQLVFNVAYGNSVTSSKLGAYLGTCPNDARKILCFKFSDHIVMRNQFGHRVMSFNWQGILKTHQVSTNRVTFAPVITHNDAELGNQNGEIAIFGLSSTIDGITLTPP
jgi:hypothetical protein